MKLVMNHAPGVGSIARPVDKQPSALSLYHGCPQNSLIKHRHIVISLRAHTQTAKYHLDGNPIYISLYFCSYPALAIDVPGLLFHTYEVSRESHHPDSISPGKFNLHRYLKGIFVRAQISKLALFIGFYRSRCWDRYCLFI